MYENTNTLHCLALLGFECLRGLNLARRVPECRKAALEYSRTHHNISRWPKNTKSHVREQSHFQSPILWHSLFTPPNLSPFASSLGR